MKITKSKTSVKIIEKLVFPCFDKSEYLSYNLPITIDGVRSPIHIYAHILFDLVFCDNNNIFLNTIFDHIDSYNGVVGPVI
ncbi:MAG: hypothetical protein Ta2E_00360 [Mycoplasmoidaceae bacterium]|nr:MAG: hypothetical protein Ta2E_00360 [Mycoplasmoidaceae bacterium]